MDDRSEGHTTAPDSRRALTRPVSEREADLDRWVAHGLLTSEQRDAILAFEREHGAAAVETGPGRLANAVSTLGAAVAIAAVFGIVALLAQDWSPAQTMLGAAVGSLVTLAAGWLLVRNGWGAPAGLCAICGLALMPVALRFAADAAGWWPEEALGQTWEETERERQRVVGIVLLLSIVPGMLTVRLGLRQAWAALPIALWFGGTLLVTDSFENTLVVIAQVVAGAVVAGLAIFVWRPDEPDRGAAWWLQTGGLLLAGQGIVVSAFDEHAIYALLGALAAAAIFVVGAVRNRTVWMVAGAVSGIFPIGSLIFDYFEGLAGLFIVGIVGLAVAFLPLLLRRRPGFPPGT